jgi:Tfp pilus assembly PilM family ATPase
MAFQKYNWVVDLGSRHLKAVQACQVDRLKYRVAAYKLVNAQDELLFKADVGEDIEIPASFARTFAGLTKEAGLKKQNLMLLLPDFAFTMNMITVPAKASDEERAQVLSEELQTLLPPDSNPAEWIVRQVDLGQLHSNFLVYVAAIRRANLLKIGTECQNLGPNPIAIDMTILNVINVFHDYLIAPENMEKNIALLNFGHQASSVAIYKQGKLTTLHTKIIGTGRDQGLLVGGRAFTRKIMEHFKLSEDEAEEYKKNEVFFLPEFVPEQDKIANYQVIKPIFGELVKGLFTITEHYVARFREFKVDEVILTGGGANFSNIDVVLGGHLNTMVRQGADMVSIVDGAGNELSAAEKNILTPAIGAFCRG